MKNIVVDGHCDTLQKAFETSLSILNKSFSFNIKDSLKNLPYIQFLASYVNTKYDIEDVAFKRAIDMLNKFYLEYEKNKKIIHLITNASDIDFDILKNKLGIVLTIENGSVLSNDLSNLETLYNKGIRVMSLTWNDDNFLGSGAETKYDCGLTIKGKKCVRMMNNLGIILDVSHASKKTFYDIVDNTSKSVIATHSCADNICKHNRNLTDEQIKLIARSKGVIGVCFYKKFLSKNKDVTIYDIANHIEYISNLVGTEFVGIGSDFDGMDKSDIPKGITGCLDIRNIEFVLNERGFNKEEIYNIMGGNYIRVLKENLK